MTIFIFGFGQVSKELAKKISNDKKKDLKIVSRNTQNFLDYKFFLWLFQFVYLNNYMQ